MRGQQAAYPFDLMLDDQGFILARDRHKRELYQESFSRQVGEEMVVYTSGRGGIGIRRDRDAPNDRETLYWCGLAANTDVGGTIDGSYGYWMRGPLLTQLTIDSGKKIYKMVPYTVGGTTKYYAAIGTKVYVSTDGLTSWSSSKDFAANTPNGGGQVTDLIVMQGANSTSLLMAAITNGSYWLFDGTTWYPDGIDTVRQMTCRAMYQTRNNGVTYTDHSATVVDGDTTTVASLSSIGALAANDWILVGSDRPFHQISVNMNAAVVNGNASVLSVHFWDLTTGGWVAVSGLTDGTAVAGASMAQDGVITWNRPSTAEGTWGKTWLDATGQTLAYYYVRLSFSAALDASTEIGEIDYLGYCEEATKWATHGKNLVRAFDKNRFGLSSDAGYDAVWFDSIDPIGSYDGSICGVATAQDTVFMKRTTEMGSILYDGTTRTYLPELFGLPSSDTFDAVTAWLGEIYFGHNYGLYRFDPVSRIVESIGLERFMSNDSEIGQVRVTAAVGDRTHFLWFAGQSKAGNSYLFKLGSFVIDDRGETAGPSAGRRDALHMVAQLGARKVISLNTYYISDQPYLLAGCDDGVLISCKLSRGINPLEANSGYAWENTADAYAYLPTFTGRDDTRRVILTGAAVIGLRLTQTATVTRTVSIATKEPDGSVWHHQVTFDTPGERVTFPDPAIGYGQDIRFTLSNSASTSTPVVQTIGIPHRQDPQSELREYTCTILAADNLVDRARFPIPLTADDWDARADALITENPITLVRPNGETDRVLVLGKRTTLDVYDDAERPARGIELTMGSAT